MAAPGLAGGWTLAVAGGKGGCGKTTAALGLAWALARRGGRPLVVDADADMPDLHLWAGVRREPGLAAVAAGTPPGEVCQRSARQPGVEVLPAGTSPEAPGGALGRIAGVDRPVFLDSPAGAGPDAAAPLRAADASVLVATETRESVRDAEKTARMAGALGAPPIGALVRRRGDVPADRRVAGVPVQAVPEAPGAPLADDRVRAAYAAALDLVLQHATG